MYNKSNQVLQIRDTTGTLIPNLQYKFLFLIDRLYINGMPHASLLGGPTKKHETVKQKDYMYKIIMACVEGSKSDPSPKMAKTVLLYDKQLIHICDILKKKY